MSQYQPGPGPVSPWAVGGIAFAGTMMVVTGIWQAFAGLSAIFDDDFYVVPADYWFDWSVTAWGWIHLIIGILVALCGFYLFARRPWAVMIAIFLAAVSAVWNFFYIPWYPWWSLTVIALDIFVIWALTRPGAIQE